MTIGSSLSIRLTGCAFRTRLNDMIAYLSTTTIASQRLRQAIASSLDCRFSIGCSEHLVIWLGTSDEIGSTGSM